MVAGYVRLSKDDDKRNYSSIENQKLIIQQYAAAKNLVIGRWYEDDGISGYLFDRPGFNRLIADLDKDVDTVLVKDFSRLGRHNAKILLLLDHFKEQGRHLIVIDDHYDSESSEDDMIGITTWFNERYVKDTSKKICRAIGAKQKEGTLPTKPPFGYQKKGSIEKDTAELAIVPQEADCIKLIFDLYIQGLGYRKISDYLTSQKIPTPSMARRRHELEAGQVTNRYIASKWSDGMVKDILDNDFYIGTFRLHKRSRKCVHGKDMRVPADEQYVFEDHHPPIIDKPTFSLVQELKEKRIRSRYKGNHGKWGDSQIPALFGSCLFCKDCGSKLTPIRRKTSSGERKYYICSTYNSKGRRYCSKSHLIDEQTLREDMIYYLQVCHDIFSTKIASYCICDFELCDLEPVTKPTAEMYNVIQQELEEDKKQLQALFSQKIRDLAANPDATALIRESYDSIQKDLTAHIHTLESRLNELKNAAAKAASEAAAGRKKQSALEILDHVIKTGDLNRKDIELLVECIYVDQNGFPEIELKCRLPASMAFEPK